MDTRQVTAFKRDLRRIIKRNKNLQKLYDVVALLSGGFPIKEYQRPHKLVGDYAQKLECHIEPDWLLI
jgi:mRNA interferase YafQ